MNKLRSTSLVTQHFPFVISSPNVARSADTPHSERRNYYQWEESLISHTGRKGTRGNGTTAREISAPGGCLCHWWASWLLASPFNSLNFHFSSKTDEVWVLKYGNLSAALICFLHFYHLPTFKPQTCSLSKALNIEGENREEDTYVSYLTLIHTRRKSQSCWWILGAFFNPDFSLSWHPFGNTWAHCLQFGTWLSFAKDTELASCMENYMQFWKVERESYRNIFSALYSILNYIVSMT